MGWPRMWRNYSPLKCVGFCGKFRTLVRVLFATLRTALRHMGGDSLGPGSTLSGLCNPPSRSQTVPGPFVPTRSRWDAATAAAVSVSLSGDAPSPGTNRTRGA